MSKIIEMKDHRTPDATVANKGGRPTIWDRKTRDLLYSMVVYKFGPYSQWKKVTKPANGSVGNEFEDFCRTFAERVGASSAAAVKQQIYFSLPIGGKVHFNKSQAMTQSLNQASAYEAGFIGSRDFNAVIASQNEDELFEVIAKVRGKAKA